MRDSAGTAGCASRISLTGMGFATTMLEREASMRIAIKVEENIPTNGYRGLQRYVVDFAVVFGI